jgi:ferredoxin-fold anticodon binding domain-containing protein
MRTKYNVYMVGAQVTIVSVFSGSVKHTGIVREVHDDHIMVYAPMVGMQRVDGEHWVDEAHAG